MVLALRLVPALFRFTGEDVIRGRHQFFGLLLLVLGVLQLVLGIRAAGGEAEGLGAFLMLGFWFVAGPLCRSWVDEDVRLGYAALWLQKPVRPLDFYSARVVALAGWAALAALAVGLSALPGFVLAGGVTQLVELVLGAGWIPTILVVLAFLGSTLGARNGALFAYAVLIGGFALPGLGDSLPVGAARGALEVVLPPTNAGLAAMVSVRDQGIFEGVARLWPLLAYGAGCLALGLLLSLKVTSRLGHSL
jgi:hypothetical protein